MAVTPGSSEQPAKEDTHKYPLSPSCSLQTREAVRVEACMCVCVCRLRAPGQALRLSISGDGLVDQTIIDHRRPNVRFQFGILQINALGIWGLALACTWVALDVASLQALCVIRQFGMLRAGGWRLVALCVHGVVSART